MTSCLNNNNKQTRQHENPFSKTQHFVYLSQRISKQIKLLRNNLIQKNSSDLKERNKNSPTRKTNYYLFPAPY